MRAVALSDPKVQNRIAGAFVPLKVSITPGTPAFPLEWPAMLGWRIAFGIGGGKDNQGFTGCSVVSPDLQVEYGSTGGAMVWELFDSPAYDPTKFSAMLDRAISRFDAENRIRRNPNLTADERRRQIAAYRWDLGAKLRAENPLRGLPPGFTIEGATRLFELSGDLKPGG